MVRWKTFGASVIGPGHVRAGLPNQDAFVVSGSARHDSIVVSDGVGSAARSEVGSKMVCAAVREAAERMVAEGRQFEAAAFTSELKAGFLQKIAPMTSRECAATCLFVLRHEGNLVIGMLGDGLIVVQGNGGRLDILRDDKAESFSNVVASFSENTGFADWKILVMREDNCRAVVLCTDGVGDDIEDVEGFMNGFIGEYSTQDVLSAVRGIRSMLENWPTPKHSDDKTIACMFREEVSHG